MKKIDSRRNALFASAFSAALGTILICSSAFAKSEILAIKLDRSPIQVSDLKTVPLIMPRYAELLAMSPDARARVLLHWQEFLIALDDEARGNSDRHALQWLFDLWMSTAEAGRRVTQPYCINQGVVKPIAECNTSLGYRMHNFDTNEKLSKLGPASQCPAGEKPCSPFFGFTAEGQMFCSSKNLTRDCDAKAKAAPDRIPLATVFLSCAGGSPGNAKVDCKALMEFVNEQASAAESLCQNAPERFACSILKRWILGEKQNISAARSAAPDRGDPAGVPAAADQANREVAQIGPKPDCPDQVVGPRPAADGTSSAATDPVIPPNCVKKPAPTSMLEATFDKLFGKIEGDHKPNSCNQIELPEQRRIALTYTNQGPSLIVQGGAGSKPIELDLGGVIFLNIISNSFAKSNPSSDINTLLANYFPKDAISDPSKIMVSLDDKSPKKPVDAMGGWISATGTKFRYATEAVGQKKYLYISMQKPGQAEPMVAAQEISASEKP